MDEPGGSPEDRPSALPRPISRTALAGLVVAVAAALAAVCSGFGSRSGWWHFRVGFAILKWAGYGGLGALLLSLIGVVRTRPHGPRRGLAWAVAGLLISLGVAGAPLYWLLTAQRVPPIHDISTDLDNPPPFVAILPLRRDAPNSAVYGGPEVAAQQREAYPSIEPVTIAAAPDQVFARARAAAQHLRWEIVEADQAEGRIEATDTTFWFGFKDDVVIRITPVEGGSRVDLRSVSREGRSDVGTNARRIQAFLHELVRQG